MVMLSKVIIIENDIKITGLDFKTLFRPGCKALFLDPGFMLKKLETSSQYKQRLLFMILQTEILTKVFIEILLFPL